jgi:hypothetical protein
LLFSLCTLGLLVTLRHAVLEGRARVMTDANDSLRDQIVQTRADLGETITELAARTDLTGRTREAVSHTRDRAVAAAREQAESATMHLGWAAGSGASSAGRMLNRLGDSPASIAAGGALGALAGLGLYALLRRRLPLRHFSNVAG